MAWLLSWLWQGMAIALVVAALLCVARRLNAATRYAIWWAALVAVVALPATWTLARLAAGAPPSADVSRAAAAEASAALPVVLPLVPDWMLAIAIGAWLGLIIVRLTNVVRAGVRLRRLKRACVPLPGERERRLGRWLAVRAQGRPATIGVSDELTMPAALGLGRPIIALPRPLVARLPDTDLDRIVLHELAHARRYDDWARLAQSIVDAIAGVHPAVWWIGRMLDLEREAACDDFVIAHTGESTQYATCLTRTAALTLTARASRPAVEQMLAPGATRTGRELARRVHRLLDQRRGRRPWPVAASLGASAVTAVAALAIVARLSGLVVLVDAAPSALSDGTLAAARPLALVSPPGPQNASPERVVRLSPNSGNPTTGSGRPSTSSGQAASRRAQRGLPRQGHDRPLQQGQGASLRQTQDRWDGQSETPTLEDAPMAGTPRALPGAAVIEAPAEVVSANLSVLTARPIADRFGSSDAMWPRLVADGGASEASRRGTWQSVADAGLALGAGMKTAGVATAGFFARAGVSIARAF